MAAPQAIIAFAAIALIAGYMLASYYISTLPDPPPQHSEYICSYTYILALADEGYAVYEVYAHIVNTGPRSGNASIYASAYSPRGAAAQLIGHAYLPPGESIEVSAALTVNASWLPVEISVSVLDGPFAARCIQV